MVIQKYYSLVFILCAMVFGSLYFLLSHHPSDLERRIFYLERRFESLSVDDEQLKRSAKSKPRIADPGDDTVIIYNRVPKTGSTSFANVAYDLCKRNGFNVAHINTTRNSHILSLMDQMHFVQNISSWTEMKPAFYHGHFAFIDFQRLGSSARPLYVNIVRDPLERLVSYYYFLRYGDNFRPNKPRRRKGDTQTFDECVAEGGRDCDADNLWMQVPFFCGQAAECWRIGSEWALSEAKRNLVSQYLLVGVTERMEEFIALLEFALPRFFTGALAHFQNGDKSHMRVTRNKVQPSEATLARCRQSPVWRVEDEFYRFARAHFHFVLQQSLISAEGLGAARDGGATDVRNGVVLQPNMNNFRYEKIRPRALR